ncbi:MAG: KEOPS complex subunit Pcc1 [Candidatus Bathyarchaeota archaeon]|nr:KEOPS complex subunit Pcc1 [Candidatus Bathyarchaeota archaeon]
MSSCAQATIHLKFATEKQLTAVLAALQPETKALPTKRSNVALTRSGSQLTLNATAEDTVALRATLNAYLHWIQSTLNVLEALEKT